MFIKKINLTGKNLQSILLNQEHKKEFVHQMFDNIAKNYDMMNYIITFGQNISIKKQMIKNVQLKPDMQILDVCTGTGDIAVYIAKYLGKSINVTGIDFSGNMLAIARKKAKNLDNIKFIQGDALDLPFDDDFFDACFIGYGLRNLSDLKKGILEMKRVTKKDGYIINLDLGKPKGILNLLCRLYFFNIVPLLGKAFHGDFTPYTYLPKSNEYFPNQEELVKIFKELGFSEVKNYDFMFGAIAQQIAKK